MTEKTIDSWLDCDEADTGYQLMTDKEIGAFVVFPNEDVLDDEEDEDQDLPDTKIETSLGSH